MIERDHICILGRMNSGKSSLMNLLTQQETSIIDSTPGTTADTKVAFAEFHGLGPVKLFDTAGLDEASQLGEKKKSKAIRVLVESDLVLLVIRPELSVFDTEKMIIDRAREHNKQILVIYNLFDPIHINQIPLVEKKIPLLKFYPWLALSVVDSTKRALALDFIVSNFDSEKHDMKLLPFVKKDGFYILNIPMDDETPEGRFLRPQAMAAEYITRQWASAVTYRMDLSEARKNPLGVEYQRFMKFIHSFSKKPDAIITDSQAIDIMSEWVPANIDLTTFSIMMIHYTSRGKLVDFYNGICALDSIVDGDRILIVEACNHSRIQEDIGTVQIPAIIKKRFPGVLVDFNFGREFQSNSQLEKYSMIIHCGGCMISDRKLQARLRDLKAVGVPITNYGIFLSWAQGTDTLKRVCEPWFVVE